MLNLKTNFPLFFFAKRRKKFIVKNVYVNKMYVSVVQDYVNMNKQWNLV